LCRVGFEERFDEILKLGSESKIDAVEIRWPSGKIENLKNLAADYISIRSLRENVFRTKKLCRCWPPTSVLY
jgi:hypothetical protein